MRRALITGASGQDGILLSKLLIDRGYDVWAMVRPTSTRLPLLEYHAPQVRVVEGDVSFRPSVRDALEASAPHEVYNLAALSSVARSWSNVEAVIATNIAGVANVLEEIKSLAGVGATAPRFYQASSSEMFGLATETPQDEQTPFHPRSPYGVSKCAAHYLTVNYRESFDLYACAGILFNHESPLRGPYFVTKKIARGVASIALGYARDLALGQLDVTRDWGFAPDYVEAMWLMMQGDQPREYVIATGVGRKLQDFVAAAFACVGIDDWAEFVTLDASLLRPAEAPALIGNGRRAERDLGWTPRVGFERMVELMVSFEMKAMQGHRLEWLNG